MTDDVVRNNWSCYECVVKKKKCGGDPSSEEKEKGFAELNKKLDVVLRRLRRLEGGQEQLERRMTKLEVTVATMDMNLWQDKEWKKSENESEESEEESEEEEEGEEIGKEAGELALEDDEANDAIV